MAKLTRETIYQTAEKLSNRERWRAVDQFGTLNTIAPEDMVAAAGLVKQGKVFPDAKVESVTCHAA